MIHAFLLYVLVGQGAEQRMVSNDMYFRSLDSCLYYAQRLHKQGNKITAYCLPRWVDKGTQIYD